MTDEIVTDAEEWLLRVGLKKAAVHAAMFLMTSAGLQAVLTKYGVTVNWNLFQTQVLTTVVGLVTFLIDYLKVKKGWTWL